MSERATTPEQLAAIIHGRSFVGPAIIGIDGATASGKSTLSEALGTLLNANVLSLDSFLNQHEGRFFESLRLAELRERLADAKGMTIVEGVLLLRVLEAVSAHSDLLVYVKRVGLAGQWQDEDEC